jgi:SAM-dependent methyltransferase
MHPISIIKKAIGYSETPILNNNNNNNNNLTNFKLPYKLHLGPGPNWTKPDNHWIAVDIEPQRGDIIIDFNNFKSFPFKNNSVACIYGSHVFEHMSIYITQCIFEECYRVLLNGGIMRLILPDVEKSIKEYIKGNKDFNLFKRRIQRAKKRDGLKEYTLFDCLREDFLSKSSQSSLGQNSLAHQNAWDFETISKDLSLAGFSHVEKTHFQKSRTDDFSFEGKYQSEANEIERSLYVEAIK